jgi:glycosyltransferase involved in cell wall biosynthesis
MPLTSVESTNADADGAGNGNRNFRAPAELFAQWISPMDWNMDQIAGRACSDLVCFAHLRWDFVFQRPQHLLSRAADHFRVHYFEEPIYENVSTPCLDAKLAPEGVCVIKPVLPLGTGPSDATRIQRKLVADYVRDNCERSAVGWYYTPAALSFTRQLSFSVTVYDCMDELSQFKGASPELVTLERELLQRADAVFTGGLSLFEAKAKLHDNVHVLPSSVDVAHFLPARSRDCTEPLDLAAIPHPRIGYFGVIDERIDYALIDELAAAKPDWQIVMIGPTAKVEISDLPSRANIHWLGRKDYKQLPEYLAYLDVGFMPFAMNAATRFISPTKTPEFLAAGCPVISTPVLDVVRTWGEWQLVEIAHDARAASEAVERLLAHRDRSPWLAQVDEKLSRLSWDRTWSSMLREIERLMPRTERKTSTRALSPVAVSHV